MRPSHIDAVKRRRARELTVGAPTSSFLGQLRCPRCGGPIDVVDAAVTCPGGHRFRLRDGYVDLSTRVDEVTARTLESFGYEWNAFDAITPEDDEYWRWYFADVPVEELSRADAVDVGCGKGRFTRSTARHTSTMVALDGSDAVRAAARNLGDLDNVVVVRADLHSPVLPDESFDFVSSLGVLHHLSDPEEGFARLVRVLRPGGRILVYVYSRPEKRGVRSVALSLASAIRRVTTRLPHRVLRPLAAPIAWALYAGVVLPGAVGERRGISRLRSLPLSVYRGKPPRALWLDTFDRLSAPLEARYRPEEVAAWFTRAGLEIEALREDAGIFALGRRPIAA